MTIYNLDRMEVVDKIPRGCVTALGFFDGVHLGHRLIIDSARREADLRGVEVAVWTISHESGNYKTGNTALTNEAERLELLSLAGAHYAAVSDFSDIKGLSGEGFVKTILAEKLGVSAVACGYNYRFGNGALCTTDVLRRICSDMGIDVIVTEAVTDSMGDEISSTRIRNLISEGRVDEGDVLLGRPYGFTSRVLRGKRLGRKLGFPTANQLVPEGRLTPKTGVYAVTAEFYHDGVRKILPGVTNIGYCPTLTEEMLASEGVEADVLGKNGAAAEGYAVSETYIIGFDGDLYGEELKLSFLKRLRGEIAFDGIDALVKQIGADADRALEIYGEIYGFFYDQTVISYEETK